MVEISYVKWGLANRFDDGIEMNEALKKDRRLHDAILDHELGHKKKNTFKQDLVHDLTPINRLDQRDLLVFMIKNPRTLTQLLPIYWSPKRRRIIYDLNMILIYGILFTAIAITVALVI